MGRGPYHPITTDSSFAVATHAHITKTEPPRSVSEVSAIGHLQKVRDEINSTLREVAAGKSLRSGTAERKTRELRDARVLAQASTDILWYIIARKLELIVTEKEWQLLRAAETIAMRMVKQPTGLRLRVITSKVKASANSLAIGKSSSK